MWGSRQEKTTRFVETVRESVKSSETVSVLKDTLTGVSYLVVSDAGLTSPSVTVLLDADGKPLLDNENE